MKKLIIIAVAVVLVMVMGLGVIAPQPVTAQEGWGGKNAIPVTLNWEEGYTMYGADGTPWGGPWWYHVGPVAFKKNPKSETYRTTDMNGFMAGGDQTITGFEGFLMVNRTGELHGEVTYGPIYQEFWSDPGDVEVTMTDGDTATMSGIYHDRLYFQQPDGSLVFFAYGDYQVTP